MHSRLLLFFYPLISWALIWGCLSMTVVCWGQCGESWVVAQSNDEGVVGGILGVGPFALESDPMGNLYSLGWAFGNVTLYDTGGPWQVLGGPDSLAAYLLVRYDVDGSIRWAHRFQLAGDPDFSPALTIRENQVVIVLTVRDELAFADELFSSEDGTGIFWAAFDLEGNVQQYHFFSGEGNCRAYGVASAPDGGWLISGQFSGVWNLEGGISLEAGPPGSGLPRRGFVVKLDEAGTPLWAAAVSEGPDSRFRPLAVDEAGDVYAGGFFKDTLTWGDTEIQFAPTSGRMPFLAKMNGETGAPLWAVGGNPNGSGFPNGDVLGLSVGPAAIYATGYFSSPIEFGGWASSPAGRADAFVVAASPSDGSVLNWKKWGSADSDELEWGSELQLTPYQTLLWTANLMEGTVLGNEQVPLGKGGEVVRTELDLFLTPIQITPLGGAGREFAYASNLDAEGQWSVYGYTESAAMEFGGQEFLIDHPEGGTNFIFRECLNLLDVPRERGLVYNLSVAPNPTIDQLHIGLSGMQEIVIVNAWGQIVFSEDGIHSDELQVDCARWPSGWYGGRVKNIQGEWQSFSFQVVEN
jgi:hypothetical protein